MDPQSRAVMSEMITLELHLAKRVFEVHGATRRTWARTRAVRFCERICGRCQASCVVVVKACGGASRWGRQIGNLGHDVWRIPSAYVQPFVKCHNNDAANAEVICFDPARTRQKNVYGP